MQQAKNAKSQSTNYQRITFLPKRKTDAAPKKGLQK